MKLAGVLVMTVGWVLLWRLVGDTYGLDTRSGWLLWAFVNLIIVGQNLFCKVGE